MEKGLLPEAKEKVKDFLRRNLDVFVWRHEDMMGIDPKVSCHYLKIDHMAILHRQKKKTLNM